MRLFLLRHGQTPSNVAGELDTAAPGAGLTQLGQRQAAAIPGALAGERVAAVYASPLVRTQLTATPLAEEWGHPVVVRAGLEEISAGALEMASDEASVAAYTDCVAAWMLGDLDHVLPGGADGRAFLGRYDAALRAVSARHADDETVVVVSHGAAIRAFTALRADGLDPREATELRIANTGGALFLGDPDRGWHLDRWISAPIGGAHLLDQRAHDVTGESTEDVDRSTTDTAPDEVGHTI